MERRVARRSSVILVAVLVTTSCASSDDSVTQQGADASTSATGETVTGDTDGGPISSSDASPSSAEEAQDAVGGDPGPNPSTIEFTLDESAAATSTIGSEGGSLTTVSTGVEATLTIPPGALAAPTEITMTPVSEAESDLVQLAAGVQFAPSGLLLAEPAVLEFKVETVPADLMAVSWNQSGGEVVPTVIAPPSAGRLQIPIVHFSGAGAGTPGEGASTGSASSKADRGIDLINDEFKRGAPDYECVEADSPAGVTAVSYYISAANEEVIPALKQAQSDDLALLDASLLLLEWWALPDELQVFADVVACQELVDAFTDARDGFTDEVGARLEAGFTHAIYEAVRQCKARTDPGEVRHMVQWHERAILMMSIGSIGTPDGWESLLVDAVKACAVFRVELRTQLTLDAGEPGRIRGTIAATASDVPERIAAEILGYSEQGAPFAFDEPSYHLELPHNGDNCVYEDRSGLESMSGQFLRLAYQLPERRIPGLTYTESADTSSENEGGENEDGDDSNPGQLVIDTLEPTGQILVHCDDLTFPVPKMSSLAAMWFNGVHKSATYPDALEFALEEQSDGSLVASFTSDEPIIDPTDPTAKVEQHTEVKVFHTPQSMARPQPPPPPPDVFR